MTTMPITVEQVPIDQLHPDPANPRRIGEDELESLTRSLRQFGFVQPVLARKEDSTVIGGHQRLIAARRLGLTSVPVIWLDLSVEQARLLNLALNKISGSWDDALLARLLADLQSSPDIDLSLSRFGEDEIKDLLRSLETREKREQVESFDLDEALAEATRTPRAKLGDLWLLGDHRLACGDSTNPEAVARLLGGAEPRLLATDPPYGVSLDGSWRDGVYNALGPAERTYMRQKGARNTTMSGDTRRWLRSIGWLGRQPMEPGPPCAASVPS
jgi:ParB-like nuclease domain